MKLNVNINNVPLIISHSGMHLPTKKRKKERIKTRPVTTKSLNETKIYAVHTVHICQAYQQTNVQMRTY
uniref:Uncharacterized protein n=1 Tax=Anguilla anguilla TaxID=7936 RepID=A0A0E9WJ82_ANGAN